MIDSIKNIFSPGVLEWVKPKKLVEALQNCCRLVGSPFNKMRAITNTEYSGIGTRDNGVCVSVKMSDICARSTIAGMCSIEKKIVAGETHKDNNGFSYFITELPEGLVAIGKSPDSTLGLLYSDFIPHGNGYLFRDNPVKYGTVSTISGDTEVSFYCVGSKLKAEPQPQFKPLYKGTCTREVIRAVRDRIGNSACLAGISGTAIHAAASVGVIQEAGPITRSSWVENNRNYICVGDSVYSCPDQFSIDNDKLMSDDLRGLPITSEHINRTIMFPVNSKWHWFEDNRMDQNIITRDVFKEYPELVNSVSLYDQLKSIMTRRGVVTVDISNCSKEDNDVEILYQSIPVCHSVHLVKHIDITPTVLNNSIEALTVDVIYILYANRGEYTVPVNGSAQFILNGVNETKGVMRISGCTPQSYTDGDLTSIHWHCASINAEIKGPRLLPTSKIYGIVLVHRTKSGGNYRPDDVVYSYSNIKNEPIGPGLEVLVWAEHKEEL